MTELETAQKIVDHSGKKMAYLLAYTAASMDDELYPYEFAGAEGDKEFWKKVLSIINRYE
ncbi:MAG: hypothetical protein CMH22_06260 [Methylophaga sp.]|nr:hypothetical protein [Methylophaga sp.]|tara:strand:+ start:37301 stop:37480 length:180 start_codon:yes stop_codon:yes gene_type:complete